MLIVLIFFFFLALLIICLCVYNPKWSKKNEPKREANKTQSIKRPIWFVKTLFVSTPLLWFPFFAFHSLFCVSFQFSTNLTTNFYLNNIEQKSKWFACVGLSFVLRFLFLYSSFFFHYNWGLDNWIMVMEINTIVIEFVCEWQGRRNSNFAWGFNFFLQNSTFF